MSIVWFASYPKSGNTLLRLLMHAYVNRGSLDINSVAKTCYHDQDFMYWQMATFKPLHKFTERDFMFLRPAALMNMVEHRAGGWEKKMLVKSHHANFAPEGIPMFPQGMTDRAVYLVRNPLDLVPSLAHHMGTSIDATIERINDKHYSIKRDNGLFHFLGTWSGHVQTWTNEDKFKVGVIKFEDLVQDTEATFKKIIKFLDVTLEEDTVTKAAEACRFENLQRAEKEEGFIEASDRNEKFFRRGEVGSWREELTKEQANTIRKHHGPMMKKYGYA